MKTGTKMFLSLVLLLAFVRVNSGFECYQCTWFMDQPGPDTCKGTPSNLVKCNPTVGYIDQCWKQVDTYNGKVIQITRDCVKGGKYPNKCNKEDKVESCFCEETGCNGARKNKLFQLIALLAIFTWIFL